MKLNVVRWAVVFSILFVLASVKAEDKPKASTSVINCEKVTLIEVEAKDRALFEIISEIAKKMGFEKVVDKDKSTDGQKYSCSYKQKPAWECLSEICLKNNLVFGGAGIGEDFALGVAKAGKWKTTVRTSGGFAAVFTQAPAGTAFNDPFRRPFSLRILTEPTISCTFKEPSVTGQKNAVGKDCDLIGLQAVPFGVQESLGKDKSDPWPELSAFTLKTSASVAKQKIVATVSGMSMSTAAFPVQHDGKELFTIVKVSSAGMFVVLETSIVSGSKDNGVMQGGWGQPLGPAMEAALGARIDFTDAKGGPVSPGVIAWEGDGTHSKVTFKFPKGNLDASGGISGLTARYSKVTEKEETKLEFQFADLGLFKP